MNFFKIMNRYWRVRQQAPFKSAPADLFYHLVQESNRRKWENPFSLSNVALCATTRMSLSTMKRSRDILLERGVIGYQPGTSAESEPQYKLYEDDDSYQNDVSGGQIWTGGPVQNRDQIWAHDTEDSNTNTFVVPTSAGSAGGEKKFGQPGDAFVIFDAPLGCQPEKEKSCAEKEKAPDARTVPHWRAIVGRWFAFNHEKLHIKVSFKGRDPKCLKDIMLRLEDQALDQGREWTEQHALKVFELFLRSAWTDEFLRKKFLLINLLDQYDAIISNQLTGAFATVKSGGASTQTGTPKAAGKRGATLAQILTTPRSRAANATL